MSWLVLSPCVMPSGYLAHAASSARHPDLLSLPVARTGRSHHGSPPPVEARPAENHMCPSTTGRAKPPPSHQSTPRSQALTTCPERKRDFLASFLWPPLPPPADSSPGSEGRQTSQPPRALQRRDRAPPQAGSRIRLLVVTAHFCYARGFLTEAATATGRDSPLWKLAT
jgi:hypothetical protein